MDGNSKRQRNTDQESRIWDELPMSRTPQGMKTSGICEKRLTNTEETLVENENTRNWDELPADILTEIFNRVYYNSAYWNISCVCCTSWRSSFLDSIFSSPNVLDLSKLDFTPNHQRGIYIIFLKKVLDTRPQAQWKKLCSPHVVRLKEDTTILYIAQRTPFLQDLYLGNHLHTYTKALAYWTDLKELTCQTGLSKFSRFAPGLGIHCKKIIYLCLIGYVSADDASAVVSNLPQLKYLNLRSCNVSLGALLILDRHENLETIDLRHSRILGKSDEEWNEISKRLTDVNRYLVCHKSCTNIWHRRRN